jgi:transposase
LKNRPKSGRPPRMTPQQWQDLLKILQAGAIRSGFETERWTLPRIRDVIAHRLGVDYHPAYLSVKLRELGRSVQVPEVQARERDEAVIRAWVEHDWPRIKKKPAAGVR